jgi:hypothetical protein
MERAKKSQDIYVLNPADGGSPKNALYFPDVNLLLLQNGEIEDSSQPP